MDNLRFLGGRDGLLNENVQLKSIAVGLCGVVCQFANILRIWFKNR